MSQDGLWMGLLAVLLFAVLVTLIVLSCIESRRQDQGKDREVQDLGDVLPKILRAMDWDSPYQECYTYWLRGESRKDAKSEIDGWRMVGDRYAVVKERIRDLIRHKTSYRLHVIDLALVNNLGDYPLLESDCWQAQMNEAGLIEIHFDQGCRAAIVSFDPAKGFQTPKHRICYHT